MLLDKFYTEKDSQILISKQQASNFAKQIANDYNPIHDQDSERFCVPGDLLFSIVLTRYGLGQQMTFHFSGMVGDNVPLNFPDERTNEFSITDDQGKDYLHVEYQGDVSTEEELISLFSQNYVAFSGKNFPDLIVPLMRKHNVMINPDRPLVIYESMSIDLKTIKIQQPTLELTDTSLTLQGRKGIALLEFCVKSAGSIIGKGEKKLALRGLSQFEQKHIDKMVNTYHERKVLLKPE